VSFVLLWQPSDRIDLFVIDYIFVLFSENKYDDDDDDDELRSYYLCLYFQYARGAG